MDHALVIFTIKLANKKSSFEPVVFRMGAWSPPLPPPPPPHPRKMSAVWRNNIIDGYAFKKSHS